ncbi:hypothetical protein MPH_00211 [Macrophomina phaseolina MS6]|uniref:Vegetatible incompatibility protein HET-E-1 n=1 Tax=Macrophomina phaseolina (strain MS6) TaxID=1126212 RepID=K2RIT3_MACPH|nr:hypothetical protein MPH_00211 [Macrophomina phaseolina MS6]
MNEYEARRLENIKRNQALVQELGLERPDAAPVTSRNQTTRSSKRRKLEPSAPTRSSARIASAGPRPLYNDHDPAQLIDRVRRTSRTTRTTRTTASPPPTAVTSPTPADVQSIREGWTAWTPAASPPTRAADGTFHFASHPDFTPNKSPEEILREGCFGGTYWRPLYSKKLGITVRDDWRELPAAWTAGLDAARYLTGEAYDPSVNKYGVACGQSIEEWEAAGWIAHDYDVRGWFQWYCRFWMGRRCEDDERQIGRWKRCVGDTGRWRRALLKKYVAMGIRSVFDDGDGDGDDGRGDVSPVVHQTCHHWAYEVRQGALDRFWAEGR